jgi:hypothetical protein
MSDHLTDPMAQHSAHTILMEVKCALLVRDIPLTTLWVLMIKEDEKTTNLFATAMVEEDPF